MSRFTLSNATLAPSLLVATLGCTLLAQHANGQLINNRPTQLRPNNGSAPANLAPPAAGGLTPPMQTDARKIPVAPAEAMVTADFGIQPQNAEQKQSIVLFMGGYTGKAPDESAPSSIRITGGQAKDFSVTPAECSWINQPAFTSVIYSFRCTVAFRASAEGPRAALLEVMFPNGDRYKAALKGIGKATYVAMPSPGGVTGTGMQAQMGNKPPVGVAVVSETLDFGYVNSGARKTLRVATQYPAGTRVLSHFGGAKISDGHGKFDQFILGETALSLNGAASGEKASFTITFVPAKYCTQEIAYFTFRDANGLQRQLELKGSCIK